MKQVQMVRTRVHFSAGLAAAMAARRWARCWLGTGNALGFRLKSAHEWHASLK